MPLTILETTFSGVKKELMKRLLIPKKKKNVETYPDEFPYFPMTLKFYSVKAYTYVRKTLNLGLPDPHQAMLSTTCLLTTCRHTFRIHVMLMRKFRCLSHDQVGAKHLIRDESPEG